MGGGGTGSPFVVEGFGPPVAGDDPPDFFFMSISAIFSNGIVEHALALDAEPVVEQRGVTRRKSVWYLMSPSVRSDRLGCLPTSPPTTLLPGDEHARAASRGRCRGCRSPSPAGRTRSRSSARRDLRFSPSEFMKLADGSSTVRRAAARASLACPECVSNPAMLDVVDPRAEPLLDQPADEAQLAVRGSEVVGVVAAGTGR